MWLCYAQPQFGLYLHTDFQKKLQSQGSEKTSAQTEGLTKEPTGLILKDALFSLK